jgi:hypothetical protein
MKKLFLFLLFLPCFAFGQQIAIKKEPDRFIKPSALSYFYVNQNTKSMSNIQEEIWKDVVGYEGYYQVSSFGRIKSVDRQMADANGVIHKYKGKIKALSLDNKGYLKLQLWRNNNKTTKKVHRFVALAFIPNPTNLPQVNHKDGNKSNAHVDNLEWIDNRGNQIHSFTVLGRKQKSGFDHWQSKPVFQFNSDGNLIATHGSVTEAYRVTGVHPGLILGHISGKYKKSKYPFKWAFA